MTQTSTSYACGCSQPGPSRVSVGVHPSPREQPVTWEADRNVCDPGPALRGRSCRKVFASFSAKGHLLGTDAVSHAASSTLVTGDCTSVLFCDSEKPDHREHVAGSSADFPVMLRLLLCITVKPLRPSGRGPSTRHTLLATVCGHGPVHFC